MLISYQVYVRYISIYRLHTIATQSSGTPHCHPTGDIHKIRTTDIFVLF